MANSFTKSIGCEQLLSVQITTPPVGIPMNSTVLYGDYDYYGNETEDYNDTEIMVETFNGVFETTTIIVPVVASTMPTQETTSTIRETTIAESQTTTESQTTPEVVPLSRVMPTQMTRQVRTTTTRPRRPMIPESTQSYPRPVTPQNLNFSVSKNRKFIFV